jgi:hypothetical protein
MININTSLTIEMDIIKTNITNLNTMMTNLMIDMNKIKTNITTDLELVIKEKSKRLSGSIAYSRSDETRVYISISSQNKTLIGCGSIVTFMNKTFIATCRHLFLGLVQPLQIVITFPNGQNHSLNQTPFYFDRGPDVALIPCNAFPGKTPLTVKNSNLRLGSPIWGISSIKQGSLGLHCRVIEKDVYSYMLFADCGGSPGASGTAYLNGKGELIGIHFGGGRYQHVANIDEEAQIHILREKLNVTCQPDARLNYSISNKCFDALEEIIDIKVRNHVSGLVRAAYLSQLWNASRYTNQTIIHYP